MIIHKMNRVSGFIIIITGALVRISEYHIILDILIKSRYTAVHTAVRNYPAVPNTSGNPSVYFDRSANRGHVSLCPHPLGCIPGCPGTVINAYNYPESRHKVNIALFVNGVQIFATRVFGPDDTALCTGVLIV